MILRSVTPSTALVASSSTNSQGRRSSARQAQPLTLVTGNQRTAFAENGIEAGWQRRNKVFDFGKRQRFPDRGLARLRICPQQVAPNGVAEQ
jgi:hypothetical protein